MTTASNSAPGTLPAGTRVGYARLRVSDVDRSLAFYRDLLGFRWAGKDEGDVALSASGERPYQVLLRGDPAAALRPPGTTGLYHLAILFPHRQALARVLKRLLAQGWPLHGAADHGVSEALYLADPDGNGIELYVDRPQSAWPRAGNQIAMTTARLDVAGLLAEAGGEQEAPWQTGPTTTLGHVHLQVSDLRQSERFYTAFGFQVTQRSYPGALFLSAGGYHHHVGLNVWAGEGAPPPPPGARGLISFSLLLPHPGALSAAIARLKQIEVQPARASGFEPGRRVVVHDPDGIEIELLV